MDERLRAWLDAAEGDDDTFVETAFRTVLRRSPDDEARARALEKLAAGTLSRTTLLHELATAPESERVRLLDDGIAFARGARARGERPRWLQGPPGTDERVIELPWVLARLQGGRALEVGYAFAEAPYLAALLQAGFDELTGVDLAEADVPGMTTVRADVRELPFEKGTFDLVALRLDARACRRRQQRLRARSRGGRGLAPDRAPRAAAGPRSGRPAVDHGAVRRARETTAGSGRTTCAAGRDSSPEPASSSRSRRSTS